MKRAKFTEEQIIGVLREHEVGAKTADLARKHGVSEATNLQLFPYQSTHRDVVKSMPSWAAANRQPLSN